MRYVSLIFEIHAHQYVGHDTLWDAIKWTFQRNERRKDRGMETIWFAFTDNPQWRDGIPIEFEEHGFQKIGPMTWRDAEAAIRTLKSLFDAAGLPYTEQTCSDD